MQSNFSLRLQEKNHDIHISLHGVFDGSSAFELINAIEIKQTSEKPIYIDTSHLTQTNPFGLTILETYLPKNSLRKKLHFSGTRAKEILPQECILVNKSHPKGHVCSGKCKNCACRNTESHKKTVTVNSFNTQGG